MYLSNTVLAFKVAEKPFILNNRTDAYNDQFKPSWPIICPPADLATSKKYSCLSSSLRTLRLYFDRKTQFSTLAIVAVVAQKPPCSWERSGYAHIVFAASKVISFRRQILNTFKAHHCRHGLGSQMRDAHLRLSR